MFVLMVTAQSWPQAVHSRYGILRAGGSPAAALKTYSSIYMSNMVERLPARQIATPYHITTLFGDGTSGGVLPAAR